SSWQQDADAALTRVAVRCCRDRDRLTLDVVKRDGTAEECFNQGVQEPSVALRVVAVEPAIHRVGLAQCRSNFWERGGVAIEGSGDCGVGTDAWIAIGQ